MGGRGCFQTHVFEAFKDYLNRYLDLVEAAEAETDSTKLKDIADRQKAYLKYRAEKDPARGMFTRMYGEDWTEKYIHGVLDTCAHRTLSCTSQCLVWVARGGGHGSAKHLRFFLVRPSSEFLFDLEEKMEKGLYQVGERLESKAPLNFTPTKLSSAGWYHLIRLGHVTARGGWGD